MPCFICVYVRLYNAMFYMCICEVYVRVIQCHVLYVYV